MNAEVRQMDGWVMRQRNPRRRRPAPIDALIAWLDRR